MGIVFGWVEWEGGEIGIMVRLGGVMDFGVGIHFETVKELEGKSRGGFGSTGRN